VLIVENEFVTSVLVWTSWRCPTLDAVVYENPRRGANRRDAT